MWEVLITLKLGNRKTFNRCDVFNDLSCPLHLNKIWKSCKIKMVINKNTNIAYHFFFNIENYFGKIIFRCTSLYTSHKWINSDIQQKVMEYLHISWYS